MTVLDEIIGRWDFRERHVIRVDASAERIFAAVRETALAEMPLARLLFRLRGMPSADATVFELMRRSGFVLAGEEPARELVLAAVGRPWKLRGDMRPDVDVRTFDEPGWARMALNFRLDGRVLATETRVALTDAASRRAFARYWLVIRPFSGLIRRVWLRAIKRRAERT